MSKEIRPAVEFTLSVISGVAVVFALAIMHTL